MGALSLVIAVFPLPDIFDSTGGTESALSMHLAGFELPNVFDSIGVSYSALAMPLAVFELPDVFCSIGPGIGAKTVMPSYCNIREAIWQCISTVCQREK